MIQSSCRYFHPPEDFAGTVYVVFACVFLAVRLCVCVCPCVLMICLCVNASLFVSSFWAGSLSVQECCSVAGWAAATLLSYF